MPNRDDDSSDLDLALARSRSIGKKPAAESSSSESSSSCESEDLFKPTFVPKSKRETVVSSSDRLQQAEVERVQKAALEEELLERQRKSALEQANVQERIDLGNAEQAQFDSYGFPIPPPAEPQDPELAYQLWALREYKRILKYRLGHKQEVDP